MEADKIKSSPTHPPTHSRPSGPLHDTVPKTVWRSWTNELNETMNTNNSKSVFTFST